MPFKPGQSGNPKGRAPGVSIKRTELRNELELHRLDLIRKVVSMALEGDTTAMKLCLERICPPLKSREEPVILPMPADTTLSQQGAIILQAMAEGTLAPDSAARLLQAMVGQARLVEIDELTRRIEALESFLRPGGKTNDDG